MSYNSVIKQMGRDELTPVLTDLITRASLPLKSIEQDFAIDSSGFSSSRFDRWFDHKWGKEAKQHVWVKAHLMVGVRTNVITAAEILAGSLTPEAVAQ